MRLEDIDVNTDANGFAATNGAFSGNGWFSIVEGFTTEKEANAQIKARARVLSLVTQYCLAKRFNFEYSVVYTVYYTRTPTYKSSNTDFQD